MLSSISFSLVQLETSSSKYTYGRPFLIVASALGRHVAQLVERQTLGVEVQGSKPAPGAGGGVGSHPTSPIRKDARSWMTKTLETETDNLQLTTARFWITAPGERKIGRFPQKTVQTITCWSFQQQGYNNSTKKDSDVHQAL